MTGYYESRMRDGSKRRRAWPARPRPPAFQHGRPRNSAPAARTLLGSALLRRALLRAALTGRALPGSAFPGSLFRSALLGWALPGCCLLRATFLGRTLLCNTLLGSRLLRRRLLGRALSDSLLGWCRRGLPGWRRRSFLGSAGATARLGGGLRRTAGVLERGSADDGATISRLLDRRMFRGSYRGGRPAAGAATGTTGATSRRATAARSGGATCRTRRARHDERAFLFLLLVDDRGPQSLFLVVVGIIGAVPQVVAVVLVGRPAAVLLVVVV